MAGKTDLCGDFGAHLMFDGIVPVPKMLLHNYTQLGIQEGEVILILQLLSLRQKNAYPSPDELAELMGSETGRVENMLGRLMEAGILSVESVPQEGGQLLSAYSLAGLMEQLSELWAVEKARSFEQRKKAAPKSSFEGSGSGALIKAFEKEFGRPLTEIECSNIIEWHQGSGFAQELILEALKRAVLNNTTSWRYINSILREWDKKNLRSLQDIFADDARFQESRQGKLKGGKMKVSAAKTGTKDKFKDFYL